MVFGDTVAIALMGARNLSKEEYAANHPAGRIWKSLIFKRANLFEQEKGSSLFHPPSAHYIVPCRGTLKRSLELSKEEFGFYNVSWKPRTIGPDAMAVEAMQKMESPPSPVQFLPVIDHENVLIGIVTLHGL
ncbi:hypothetical protein K7X08_003806 [Anisodus acutangulus]|uniref:CBS domain-containing protein n=1 Tax=Anisodus acutangulus TaxID=402998 RepID=A0A9Q1MGD9_9SOLA|nr:hypothetical protein K7X08_003806 [Anisodus acutangulus]